MHTRQARRALTLLATLLVGVAGCDEILGVGREERTAILATESRILGDGEGALVLSADTIASGAVLTIRIRTIGGGCIRRAFVDQKTSGDVLELRPYNSYVTGNAVCSADLAIIEHTLTQQFFGAGLRRIRAVGLSETGAVISEEDTVIVRPAGR